MMENVTRRHFVVFAGVVAMTLLRANVVAAQNSEDWRGSWAFELPDGNPAWLRIAGDGNGLEGELLWSVGSAQPLTELTLDGGTLQFRRKLQRRPFGDSAVKLIREPMIATQWNRYELTLVDRHVTVVLNDEKVIDNAPVIGCTGGGISADDTRPGPILLQGDHTSVQYRNIVIRSVKR